ncbi:MAG: site-specific integrase, partial [Deltaproteobacteria bacterium]|nr:site-specific integrase [Deltaproteobacteria bacterium]
MLSIDQAIDQYLLHLRAERNLSPHTLSSYAGDLVSFARFIEKRGLDIDQIDGKVIEEFIHLRAKEGLSPRSQRRLLSALRGCFSFLVEEGELKHNPVASIDSPKLPKHLPRFLSVDEVMA